MRDRGDYDLYYNNHEYVKGVKKMNIERFDNFFKRVDKKHPTEYKYINDTWGEKYMIVTFAKPKDNDPDILFIFRDTIKEEERDRCILIKSGTVFNPEPMTEDEMKECMVYFEELCGGEYECHIMRNKGHVFCCILSAQIMFKQNGTLHVVYSALACGELIKTPKVRTPNIKKYRRPIRNLPMELEDFSDIDKIYENENIRVVEHKNVGEASAKYKIFSVYILQDTISENVPPTNVLRRYNSPESSFEQLKRTFNLPQDGWEEFSPKDIVPSNSDEFHGPTSKFTPSELRLDPVKDAYALEAYESNKFAAEKIKVSFEDETYEFPVGVICDIDWWYKLMNSDDEGDQDRVDNILDVIDMINLSGKDYMDRVVKKFSAFGASTLQQFLSRYRISYIRGLYNSLE